MAETYGQFVRRRRRELDEEAAHLEAALAKVRAEREQIDKAAELLGAEIEPAVSTDPSDKTRSEDSEGPREVTIKELVLRVLSPAVGMTALEILAAINQRSERPFARTSLSPQLSRLKNDGKIHRQGRMWKIGIGPQGNNNSDADD